VVATALPSIFFGFVMWGLSLEQKVCVMRSKTVTDYFVLCLFSLKHNSNVFSVPLAVLFYFIGKTSYLMQCAHHHCIACLPQDINTCSDCALQFPGLPDFRNLYKTRSQIFIFLGLLEQPKLQLSKNQPNRRM
jgi:hypothetical protein